MSSIRFLVWAILFCGGRREAQAFETTYWVWHRETSLSVEEKRSLRAQHVERLYWHVGTAQASGPGWKLGAAQKLPIQGGDEAEIIPVLRLSAEGVLPLGAVAQAQVVLMLKEAAHGINAKEVQLDFDCPTRLLKSYALFLSGCRRELGKIQLSITALGGWSRSSDFSAIQASVDRIFPMFYDLYPDTPQEALSGNVRPLLDPESLRRQLQSWRSCRIPWLAGLPNFARVSIFNPEGQSRGHLRRWQWEDVCFNPALAHRSQAGLGRTLLHVEGSTVVADTPVFAGELLACRWPALSELAAAYKAAEAAGAAGIALFRLPGQGVQGAWSLRQLETLFATGKAGEASFSLKQTDYGFELVNASGSDLAPRLSGSSQSQDRGWQLEVESSEGAIFREASSGEFTSVYAHASPEALEATTVPVQVANRLTFRFAELRAGKSLQSGLVQLSRNANRSALRWRIPQSSSNSHWQPLE